MSCIRCQKNAALTAKVEEFSEVLKTQAHTLGNHGLTEDEFYSGLFRGAIERIRGQFSATMREKRDFVRIVLNYMQDGGYIGEWESTGDDTRNDYIVNLNDGRKAGVELKGCLDGNNTTIFERPSSVDEFILWSVCTNPGSDPRHNVWSGIHTRLSADIITRQQHVNGLVVWDWLCGTLARPCPKLAGAVRAEIGPYRLPPPCIYLFPRQVPCSTDLDPQAHDLTEVGILQAFFAAFCESSEQVHKVRIALSLSGRARYRQTRLWRGPNLVEQSEPTIIKR